MEDNQNNNFEEKPRVEPVNYTASMYTDTGFTSNDKAPDVEREMAYYFCKGQGAKEPAAGLVDKTVAGKGFSVCAFLFGYIYLLYRKCYAEVGVLFIVGFGVAGFGLLFIPGGAIVLSIIISIIVGFLFPWFYHNKMEKVYNKALAEKQDPRTELMKAGGVSVSSALIGVGVIVMITLLQIFLYGRIFDRLFI